VLFPKGRLPLQIFERRYLDLVSRTLRLDGGFGVCLLKEGEEVLIPGSHQQVHRVGMYARIVDWDQLPNGLLGVTVEGVHKFLVEECWLAEDQLLTGRITRCQTDYVQQEALPMEEEHEVLVGLLQQLVSHPAISRLGMEIDFGDLRQIGWRLSELIPMSLTQRQQLLEQPCAHERIRMLEALIDTMIQEG